MLDLDHLVHHMHALAGDLVSSAHEALRRRTEGLTRLHEAAGMDRLRDAVLAFAEAADQDMAVPAEGRKLDSIHPWVPAEPYTVIATDGSQIPPDYHHIAPWYVLNTGCAVLRYDPPEGRERFRLSSHPELRPPRRADEGDEAPDRSDGRASAVGFSGKIEIERLKAELALAAQLLQEEGTLAGPSSCWTGRWSSGA